MPNNEIFSELKYLIDIGINDFLDDKPNKYYAVTEKNSGILGKNKDLNISKSLEDISSIEDLKKSVYDFKNCKLKDNAKNTVFSDGDVNSKIMLIGEAPGADEDEMGIPFVGKAGQLLNKMLSAIDLNREDVYITNIIPWRPPGNRQPTTEEIIMCMPFVQRHIELINPKILICSGAPLLKLC